MDWAGTLIQNTPQIVHLEDGVWVDKALSRTPAPVPPSLKTSPGDINPPPLPGVLALGVGPNGPPVTSEQTLGRKQETVLCETPAARGERYHTGSLPPQQWVRFQED